jgi:hypothetical protein
MADAQTPWPSPSVEKRLADALLTQTATSTANEVAEVFLAPLTTYLRKTHPASDPDACATAAENAILSVCQDPTPFDPAGLPLGAFLRFVAQRDLLSELRKEHRHHRGRMPLPDVELVPDGGNDREEPGTGWDDPRVVAAVAELGEEERRTALIRQRPPG